MGDKVEVWVEVGVKMPLIFLTFLGGWGGMGLLQKSDIKVILTQVVVEVEVGDELGKIIKIYHQFPFFTQCFLENAYQ